MRHHASTTLAAGLAVLASCASREEPPGEIVALANELHGKQPEEMRDLIRRRFGPAHRDVGSGVPIEQWDVGGGTLEISLGVVFTKNGTSTRMLQTSNPAAECLFGSYEMTTRPSSADDPSRYWLGNVTVSAEGRYRYEDGGTNHGQRAEQRDNWFMLHPDGAVRVAWAEGIGPTTRLEELADGQRVATLTFTSRSGDASARCDVVADTGSMQLHCRWGQAPVFFLDKHWVHYWK